MKKLFFLSIFCLLSIIANAQSNVLDEVVWVVGDEPIMKSDVERIRIESMKLGQHIEGDPYCAIPEQLAIQKLFLHQAAIDSVEVTDNEVFQTVEEEINGYIQQVGSKEKLEEYLGKTSLQIREQLFEQKKNEMLTMSVRESLVKDVKVTPSQVRRYLKELSQDEIPFVPTMLEVQLLVRKPVVAQTEIERVKDVLRSYTEQINSGKADFATLAHRYSEDRGTAQQGGETGFRARVEFVPEFSNVAFNLTDPKAISKIFETEYGFHIVQLVEKRGERVNVRHILLKPKVGDEELEFCIRQTDSIMDGVYKGEYTFETAVSETSQDKDTRANYGIMVNLSGNRMTNDNYGSAKFEMKDLPSEVARAVAPLSVGEYSKPFIMVDKSGHEVVAIAKLRDKTMGHRATMEDDYQVLQDMLVEKLSEEKVEQWIRDMQKTTYIRINEEWRDCEFQYPGWVK